MSKKWVQKTECWVLYELASNFKALNSAIKITVSAEAKQQLTHRIHGTHTHAHRFFPRIQMSIHLYANAVINFYHLILFLHTYINTHTQSSYDCRRIKTVPILRGLVPWISFVRLFHFIICTRTNCVVEVRSHI